MRAIFVSHSHHDHAMDCGIVALKTDAVVVGSESTLNLARNQGVPGPRRRLLKAGEPVKGFGDFTVTAYRTPHPPKPVGPFRWPVDDDGVIGKQFTMPAPFFAFKTGGNFSFLIQHPMGRVLVVPSAAYDPGALEGAAADILLLGIGTLGKRDAQYARKYWDETVGRSGAKLVIPVHWDDFSLPLGDKLDPMPAYADNLAATMSWLRPLAQASGARMCFLPPQRPTFLPRGAPGNR